MNEKRDRTLFVLAAILLVFDFIRALMPVDELPSATVNGLSIALEVGMFIGVVGMAPRVLRSVPEGGSRGGWIFLLVIGVVAGLGIFGIRLSGGPTVELSPRTSTTAESGLRRQMHEQLVALGELSKKLAATHWLQTFATQDTAKIRTLTREDLQEARAICGEMREHADRILKVFADATAQGVAHSNLSNEASATRPETWQATRETYIATYDYLGLIEKHWDEWLVDPFPAATSDSKPWQREILRLMDVAGTSARQADAQIQSKTPPSVAATELGKQLHDVFYLWGGLNEKLVTLPWLKDSGHRRSLPRSALQDVRKMYQEMLGYADRALKILAEAESKKLDVSTALETPAFTRPDFWHACQRLATAISEKLAVIDQNWDEYVARPFPEAESELKPWQREARRLDAVTAAASKEMEAIVHPSAAPSPAVTEVTGLAKELRDLIASWNALCAKLNATPWMTLDFNNPAQKRAFTRHDLEEASELHRQRSASEEKIGKVLAQVKAQGIDVSVAVTQAVFLRPEFWQATQEEDALAVKEMKLIGQHWDEWLTTGPGTAERNSKPWGREVTRLQEEIDARAKQIAALTEIKPVVTAPPVPALAPPPAPAIASTPVARAPSPPANNFDQLALQTHMLAAVADYVTALKRLQATRWIKSPDANSYHPQKITGADLHDANEKLRELIGTIDKLQANLDAQTLPVPAAEKEYWQITRETSIAFQQLTRLLEDNWKEWHLSGIQPKTGETKPWQKEALRLQGEIDKLKQTEQTSILL